jgi:hypothetical protein
MDEEPTKETLMLKFMPVFVTLAAACSFVLVLHIIFTLQDYFKD